MQPFSSYDSLCAHFQATKPSSQPKTVPYKMQWLLLFSCGKERAFCSSPTFKLFRGRNAFCSGVFWGSKFITRCARPHFIALGRWLMEFFLQISGFFHLMFQTVLTNRKRLYILLTCLTHMKATAGATDVDLLRQYLLDLLNMPWSW